MSVSVHRSMFNYSNCCSTRITDLTLTKILLLYQDMYLMIFLHTIIIIVMNISFVLLYIATDLLFRAESDCLLTLWMTTNILYYCRCGVNNNGFC